MDLFLSRSYLKVNRLLELVSGGLALARMGTRVFSAHGIRDAPNSVARRQGGNVDFILKTPQSFSKSTFADFLIDR